MKYIILIIYVLFSASGVIFFRLGSEKEFSLAVSAASFSLKVSWFSVIGLVCYLCGFLLFMWLISKYQVSYLVPVTGGMYYIVILGASMLFLHERLSTVQLIGVVTIIVGIMLMNVHTK